MQSTRVKDLEILRVERQSLGFSTTSRQKIKLVEGENTKSCAISSLDRCNLRQGVTCILASETYAHD